MKKADVKPGKVTAQQSINAPSNVHNYHLVPLKSNYFTFCLFLKSMCNQFNAADLNIQVYVGKLPETGCEEEDIKEHFAQVPSSIPVMDTNTQSDAVFLHLNDIFNSLEQSQK